ncbi:MAG TPA: flavodoxin family protein [Bacteroidales bacterium]|nr:flavodoxin family protein [Bacteroidales bacterium]HPS16696.1 flavodoxin family protein [Bacteroidales bacterium]
MKVIAINGSPKNEGNTYHAITIVGNELKAAGIDFEIIQIGHKAIHGCIACGKCGINKDEKCSIDNDDVNPIIQKLKNVDGIIIGSPVYYSGVAGTMKCFLDRLFYVSGANGNLLRHKVAAAVVAVRRSGGSSTLDSLYHYLTYAELIIATSCYWNIIHGQKPGEVTQDNEGVQIMSVLGKNMAWLLKMKEATSNSIEPPIKEKRVFTNFIR